LAWLQVPFSLLLLANNIPDVTVRIMKYIINILIVIIIGRVMWIKDGDSFLMRADGIKYEVRMYGIDAPEYKQPGYKNALKTLIKLIKNKNVKVEKKGKDYYGRLIGKVYIGKTYVNLEMIKRGHAHWYKKYAPEDKDLQQAEAEAKKAKRGVWSKPDVIKPSDWRRKKKTLSLQN
jgi:endonuclease YncB( thermonuclease family)